MSSLKRTPLEVGGSNQEPGGHVTAWWLYACLDHRASSSSVVVFGETVHAAVNATPHLWVRGKEKWLGGSFRLLQDFLREEVRLSESHVPVPHAAPSGPPGAHRARDVFRHPSL